jgi:Sigma-70, region 4
LRKYSKRRVKLAKRELLTDFQNYDSYNGAEGDDQNPYDANAADLAWKTATFDTDELGGLPGLLAHLEAGIAKDVVTALLGGDLTQREVAARLRVSESTVSRALARAIEKLRGLAASPAAADQEAAAEGGVLVREDEPESGGPVNVMDGVDAIARDEREFLDFVAERTRQGRPVSPNKKAGNYAPKELVAQHGGRDQRSRITAIERTMEALFKRGELKSESDGPRSKGKLKLVVVSDNQNTKAALD